MTDALGRVVEAPLPRGLWKTQPNHVLRQDNTLLEYAPPEQVASEIDRLVTLWGEVDATDVHPMVKAAWLHHRFVQIHPFADGNGRVARALTLLVIEKVPPSSKIYWFRRQINESAHTAGHYADFEVFAGWSSLRVRLERGQLRYVASLHGAGRDPGVMAVTTFAEIEPSPLPEGEEESPPAREYIRTTTDAFRFVHSETPDQIDQRAPELEALLDEGLAVALSELLKKA